MAISQTLYHSPGQKATIFLEVLNNDGYRADAYTVPVVNSIFKPNHTYADGYPASMTNFETGKYYFDYTIPSGSTAVGSYLMDVFYEHPTTTQTIKLLYQIVVTAPFGIYSTTI